MKRPTNMVGAGEKDRPIVLQTAMRTQDPDTGEEILDFDNGVQSELWAQWLPAGTLEAWQAQQRLTAYVDGVFRIDFQTPAPTPESSRVVFDGKPYDVKGVIELGYRKAHELAVRAQGEAP